MKISNLLLSAAAAVMISGCYSYCELNTDVGKVKVDGCQPLAVYEAANVSYLLLGLAPLSSGNTWKSGRYQDYADSDRMSFFVDNCSLDDNYDSIRHAAEEVGATEVRNLVGQVNDARAWSFFIIKRRIIKTSCVLVK